MLRQADSTWRDESWRRQALMHSQRKIPDLWRTGWKAKACKSFALHLKVFKNHLHYLRHVRVLSIKPCLHTHLPEHNRSYWKVSRGWGHLITWNEPIMGHLNSFSASGGGNLNKNFPKNQMSGGLPGGLPGGMFKLRFDWYISDNISWPIRRKHRRRVSTFTAGTLFSPRANSHFYVDPGARFTKVPKRFFRALPSPASYFPRLPPPVHPSKVYWKSSLRRTAEPTVYELHQRKWPFQFRLYF